MEPSLRWRRFTEDVVTAARDLGVRMVITLGALLADVPHSRPVSITGITSDEALVEAARLRAAELRGSHRASSGLLQQACAEAGLPAVSLWASVPHYVAAAPNPKVALALVRAFEGTAGLAVDGGGARERGGGLRAPGDRRGGERPGGQGLRGAPGDRSWTRTTAENPPDEGQLPSADTIASDFQRFLRQRGPGGPGQGS